MIPDQAFELLRQGIALFESEDRSGWGSQAKSARLVEFIEQVDRLKGQLVALVGEWDGDRSWEADGALSAPSWLASHTTLAKREARQLVRAARLAHRLERVGKSLGAGDVTPAHVEVLANATRGRTALLERDVDTLVDVATTLSVDEYATAMQHWRSAADDEMARDDALLAFEERSFSLVPSLYGRTELYGSLDAEGSRIVEHALELYDRPDPEVVDGGPADGPRTFGQRRADALVQICSETVARHEESGARHHTPGVDGLIDVLRLADRTLTAPHPGAFAADPTTGEVVRPAGSGSGSGSGEALADWLRERCELTGVGPVPRDVLVRLACDAAVGRVVMRGASEVLDVGRRTRVVNRALHRAIELRDGHCTFPGCDAPLQWCDVHHLVHWADGGATDLHNCTLLCRRHHVLCHEGGWRLARGPDGPIVVEIRGRPPRRRRHGRPGPPDRGGGGEGGYDLAA